VEAPIRSETSVSIWKNTRLHVTKVCALNNTTAITPNLANLGRLKPPLFYRSSYTYFHL